jgi:hypothetical protein
MIGTQGEPNPIEDAEAEPLRPHPSSKTRFINRNFREPTRRLELLTCCLQIRRSPVHSGPASSNLPISTPRIVQRFQQRPRSSVGLATGLATMDRTPACAESPIWRTAAPSSDSVAPSRAACWRSSFGPMSAFVSSTVPAKHCAWISRARPTRSLMASEHSPGRRSDNCSWGMRGTSRWMSMRSSSGPLIRLWLK